MKIPMSPNVPNIPQGQQTMVVVPSQINAEVRNLAFMIESLIDVVDIDMCPGIKDAVQQGMAKRGLFLFLDIKNTNSGNLEIEQAKTKQLEEQKKIIVKRWGQEVLNAMLMEYQTIINKIESENGGEDWDKDNLN